MANPSNAKGWIPDTRSSTDTVSPANVLQSMGMPFFVAFIHEDRLPVHAVG